MPFEVIGYSSPLANDLSLSPSLSLSLSLSLPPPPLGLIGYYLATAAEDGVKLWDLRKLKNFRNIEGGGPIHVVQFDYSGQYLAVGGAELRIFGTKQDWSVVKTIPDSSGSGRVNDVKFGPDCKFLAVASGDRNLRLYGTPVHAASSGTNH